MISLKHLAETKHCFHYDRTLLGRLFEPYYMEQMR